MAPFIAREVHVLRHPQRVVDSSGVLVIGDVVRAHAYRKTMAAKFKPALNMQIEIEIEWKAVGISSSHYVALHVLHGERKSRSRIEQI